MGAFSHEVKPGGLSADDHAEISDRAERGQKAQQIARAIGKHPSTVQWFMYSAGLAAPRQRDNPEPYLRGGRIVRPYSREEDAFIEALRIQDYSLAKIAELTNKRFATERSYHTIQMRLIMLAARESVGGAA